MDAIVDVLKVAPRRNSMVQIDPVERRRALARTKKSLVEELLQLRAEIQRKHQRNAAAPELAKLLTKFHAAQAIAKFVYWECNGSTFEWEAAPQTLSAFLGLPLEELPKTDSEYIKLIHDQDRDRVAARYDCAHRAASDWEVEYRLALPNGEVRHIRDTGIAEVDENGECIGHTGIMQDLSEQHRSHQEREQMIADLETSNLELERFAYTVSHDLKAPLISIRGFLGLLEKDVEQGDFDRFREDLRRIDLATVSMRKVLDGLLELSRIGRVVSPNTHTSLRDVVNEVTLILDGILRADAVEIVLVGETLPLFGDRVRLVQLLQNLVENAVNNMGEQPYPRIDIGCRDAGEELICSVADNGIGLEQRYHSKVFDLFETLGNDRSRTGIGLAIAKRIVEHHGGRIWLESEGPGAGSTFLFSLPKEPHA